MDELKRKLYNFIEVRCNRRNLKDSMQLWKDLKLEGLNAEHFMNSFAKEFDVDMDGFVFSKYFFSEEDVNTFFQKIYRPKADLKALERGDISIADLYDVAFRKKWL